MYMSTSQRTEDQWPMTSWLVHVARARVHVTTRVTTRASELSTWLHMHVYHGSKICTYIQEILLSRPAFFSSHLRCYRIAIKFLYLSLSSLHFLFFSTFLNLLHFFTFIHQRNWFSRELVKIRDSIGWSRGRELNCNFLI